MDHRRSIILVALAVVSYMLILAWNDDYGQIQKAQTVSQTVNSEQALNTNIQASISNSDNNADDFTVPESRTSNDAITSGLNDKNIESKLVHISTDVLDIKIDLKGGNIVSATLPNYKSSLGSDKPLSILDKK